MDEASHDESCVAQLKRGMPFFAHVDPAAVSELAAHVSPLDVKAGETLIGEAR
jgi:hypothetical protein